MTQDEIIEMAEQAGFFVKDNDAYSPSVQEDHELTPYLVAFVHLVAAKKREFVGLTDEEIAQGCKESWVTEQAWQSAVWWAEAKLKEKNT